MNRWYAVQTHAQSEAKALFHLHNQGFEAYLPRYHKQRRHARRIDIIKAPLFPRYLFVRLDTAKTPWRAINSTIGVVHLISRSGQPASLPDGIIEALKAQEDDLGCIMIGALGGLNKGDQVEIFRGPFCDQIGVFERIDENERVTIMLNLLGREVRVNVLAHTIKAVA